MVLMGSVLAAPIGMMKNLTFGPLTAVSLVQLARPVPWSSAIIVPAYDFRVYKSMTLPIKSHLRLSNIRDVPSNWVGSCAVNC